MSKTGADHLRSLDDGRTIYIDGERVTHPLRHPAFHGGVQTVARLYDVQAAEADTMTFASPSTGRRVGLHWKMPTSHADLVARRQAMTRWSRETCGFFGRSPDHIPTSVCGMLMALNRFERHGAERARALQGWFQHARDNDLHVTYTILNPQSNQAQGPAGLGFDRHPGLRIVDEDGSGITVNGAKMLGTAAVMANEVFVANITPLKPAEAGFGAWTALVAPKGTPREVCDQLTRQVRAALGRPEVIERLRPMGIEPLAGTPDSVLASARVEHARFGELIRRLDLKA